MADGPIYIGGLDRSGKTTMQAFLTSHPRIAIPYVGSNLWRYFYGQYGPLSRQENFERCLTAMLGYSHVRDLNPDPARIRREFWQGDPTYARLFALLHEHYAEQQGKPRWGDQTGLLEGYADYLFAADPETRMIHMVRDPRDRYEASLTRSPKGKGRVGGATARWLHSMRMAKRNRQRYPDRYMVVRYESLVRAPEATLAKVCAFLGEPYFPEMLSMHGSPNQRAKLASKTTNRAGKSPVTTEYIGGYRGVVPDQEIVFMQMFAGREMLAQGYALESVRFSPREWLSFACVTLPANLARAFAWQAREGLQDGLPSYFKRRPDDKTRGPLRDQQGERLSDDLIAR